MLRLVQPAPAAGQGTDPPARRKGSRSPALSLTPDESRNLRATIRNAARAYGGFPVLAGVVGVPVETLYKARRHGAALALRVARAAGMSVEAVLSGQLSPVGRCPACGSRVGDRPALRAGGAA